MARKGTALIALLLFSITLGCSDKKEETKPAGDKKADQTASSTQDVGQQLVGVWLGGAVLEEELVQKQLDAKPDEESREKFLDATATFLSTVVAFNLKSDGTLEQELELVSADGNVQQGSSQGKWRVIDQEGDKVMIEIVETYEDGATSKYERLFQFFPDGNRFAMPIPVEESLAACNPLIVFSRQADLGENLTAEKDTENLSR